MGLDIVVRVNQKDVLQALNYNDCGVADRPRAVNLFYVKYANDFEYGKILTRPGSYGGLHVVRAKFIEHVKVSPEPLGIINAGIPDDHKKYHLLNHSDCDGWYLPDDFETPVWADGTSIGSSIRLLQELELIAPREGDDWVRRWEAVYIAAVASVTCRQPIIFC